MQRVKKSNYSLNFVHNDKINNLLSPVFQAVRKNKINSYFQFRTLFAQQNDASPSKRNIFYPQNKTISFQEKNDKPLDNGIHVKKMAKTFHVLNKTNKNFILGQDKKASPDQTKIRMNKTYFSSSVSPRKYAKTASSKKQNHIKKHLVQNIDFEQIQKMLYKKRDWLTRYEHFYGKLQQKKQNSQSSPNKRSKQKERSIKNATPKTNPRNLTPDILQVNTSVQPVPIRNTPRKKFFIRDSNRSKLIKKQINPQNFQLIQGKSFKAVKISEHFSPQSQILKQKQTIQVDQQQI